MKFGSDSVSTTTGLDHERIAAHAERLAPLHEENDLLVVTSGAIARGKRRVLAMGKNLEDYDDQTLAHLGSAGINDAWERAFERVGDGLLAGQVLLTHREMQDSEEGPYFRQAYDRARRVFAIPILNHNDFLVRPGDPDDEMKEVAHYADNDRLAKDVAIYLGAKTLILATGVEGFKANGEIRETIAASEVEALKEHVFAASNDGTGGMDSKLDNAAEAAEAGIETFICSADANFAAIVAHQEICSRVVQYA